MDSLEPQDGVAVRQTEGSDRTMLQATPAASAPDAGDVRGDCGVEIAEAGAAVEVPPTAAAPAVSDLCMVEGVEGVVPNQGRAASTLLNQVKMEADEAGTADEEQTAVPVASGSRMAVDESSNQEQNCLVLALPSVVKTEGGEGGVVDQQPTSPAGIKKVKEEEGECLVGRYISRSAAGNGRIHLGKVASYDSSTGVYSVVFEDGQGEDLGLPQLRELLMAEERAPSGMKVSCRKRKLDLLVSSEVKAPPSNRLKGDSCQVFSRPDGSQQSGSGSDVSDDAESSSNSSDSTKELSAETCPPPPVQGPDLPPSSGDIAVPEESISYLFSVYNFLRSFSVQLFLSPFGLDDFVASVNSIVQNTLLDAVHVSLLRALRRHLEAKSSRGSELASNCLKYLDWALLDALTWPTFLLEYLYLMGCIKNLGGQNFGRSLLANEYYELPVSMKLKVLQILCDHVIDSEELKTELEAREGYSEEMEYEIDSSIFSESGSRAVLTRASKPFACKKTEDLQNSETAPNVTDPQAVVANASQDGNSDDCRLCGMDGTLVCCDGCPWAYHSRCIGLNKAFLPQGDWFCPECVVNKLGPASSRIERGARGAQMFGIDMCGRLFLGSCNYLLVIGTSSSNAESYARYYNQYDAVKVLQILAFLDAYTDICRKITEYWRYLLDIYQNGRSKIGREASVSHTIQSNMLSSVTPMKAGDGSVWTTLKDGGDNNTAVPSQINVKHAVVPNQVTACSAEHLEEHKLVMTNIGTATEKNNEVFKQTVLSENHIHPTSRNGASQPTGTSSISHQNGSMVTGASNVTNLQPAHGLVRPNLSACGSGINNSLPREDIGSTISVKGDLLCPSYQSKHPLQLIAENFGNLSGGKPAKMSSFRPQAYVNLYNHGNVAASAAANLAVLTSDEGKTPASQIATNPRKKMAADCALQVKAFSSAASQFIWPSTEKKLMEVPRDRCGWCIACKSSATGNKRACFLNLATANAAKGSARILSVMHVIKSSESHFPSIIGYLANMEESLRGLLVGSLQDIQERQRWRKQLEEALNCRTIVPLLLELESNIRSIAFLASWFKLIDDWPVESPSVSAGASRPAAHQRRGTGGRRGRKRSLASESATATAIDDDNSWKEVNWWSGGNISKRILQRGALLISTIRKAARQGGKKRIGGLSYHEASNFPRRTRQISWRACVGLTQNSSQLALLVRYLDAHIRWKEFIPPDQIPSDGKSSDADFSALRNAVVCDRKMVDSKIRYALKFPKQKHLPVRVTKNILEAEDNQDVNGKLWFAENHVPLYMVREFELNPVVSSLPSPGILLSNCPTNFYQRRAKAYIGDIFSYLFHKGDVYPCTSCKKDVTFRDVVNCSSCQGNCHKECTSKSVGSKGGNATPILTCKLCIQKRNLMLTNYSTNASYALPQPKSNGQLLVTTPKIIFKVGSSSSAEPVAKAESLPVAKVEAQPTAMVKTLPVTKVETWSMTNVGTHNIAEVQAQPRTKTKKPKSEKPKKKKKVQEITYFGLVWKKNKNDNSGSDFRANDVILSKDGKGSSIKPTCCLCNKPYCPDFLYVCCERCRRWFHGDALQLEEERIGELVQYRCCRCRRRAIPKCPYSDDYRKPEAEFAEQPVATSSQSTMFSSEGTSALADQDPLLASYGIVEPVGEETMDADLSMNMASLTPGLNQKLSIRRAQVKNCEHLDQSGMPVNEYYIHNQPPGYTNINFGHANELSLSEANGVDASELLGWDFSQGKAYTTPSDFAANGQWNDSSCGSFVADEYEPQTYFSFTELLEADDTQLDNTFGMPTGPQNDGSGTGCFDQQGITFDEMAFMVEDGSSNMHLPANDPTEELACHKCKNPQPPPNLKCAVCGLHIHRNCSPWGEGEQPADSADWSCGSCREWR